jgi:glutaredoxin
MQAVKMYTTAVCPYCIRAKQLLKARGVEVIEEIRIDLNPAERDQMMATTQRRTVPQFVRYFLTERPPWLKTKTPFFKSSAFT